MVDFGRRRDEQGKHLGRKRTWGVGWRQRRAKICHRVQNTPELHFQPGLQWRKGLPPRMPPPLAPGRIIYFSNSERAGAGSAQPLPVGSGSFSGAQRSARLQECPVQGQV